MQSQTSDNDIITRVLRGEHQLYSLLVERYQNFVFTVALKYVPAREDAEEIAQDVFVKAYKALSNFRGESRFSTWLYSIVNTTSITFLRKRKMPIHSLDNEKVFEVASNETSPLSVGSIEQKSSIEMVAKAIQLLNPEDAKIITLFYKAEQSLEDISKILNIEPNTAKVKLHRARGRLKEVMKKYFTQEVKDLNY